MKTRKLTMSGSMNMLAVWFTIITMRVPVDRPTLMCQITFLGSLNSIVKSSENIKTQW